MKNFRTLQLALELNHSLKSFRASDEHLRDQLRRASQSIVLNLGEGSGRLTAKDRRRFYAIALGSLREVQSILMMEGSSLTSNADLLGASIYRLNQNPGSWH